MGHDVAGIATWCSPSTRPAALPSTTRTTATARWQDRVERQNASRRRELAFAATATTQRLRQPHGLGVMAATCGRTRTPGRSPDSRRVGAGALVNITVTNTPAGFLGGVSTRSLRPPTSVVNVVQPGEDVANASVVTLDAEGRFVLHATMRPTSSSTSSDVSATAVPHRPERLRAGRPGPPGRHRRPSGSQLPSDRPIPTSDVGRVATPVAGQLGVPAATGVGARSSC